MCLRLPLLLASCGGQGGVVSTLRDGVTFLQAFFDGRLFDAALLDEMLTDWHRIFSPLEYGTGVMRFRLPAVFTGFRSFEFQGHSGASGVVWYRDARSGVLVVGTVITVVGYILQHSLHELSQTTYQASAQRNATLIESLTALETIKTQGAEGVMQSKWEKSVAFVARINNQMRFLRSCACASH